MNPPRVEEAFVAGDNLLDKLCADDRARLFAPGRSRVYEAGEEVIRQGSVGDCLFVIEEGELAVVRALPGDEEKVLMTARAGVLLGELAVLDGGARAASLRALRRSVLRVIPLGAFEAATLYGGEPGHRILRAIAALVHERLDGMRAVAAAQLALPRAAAAPTAPLVWSAPISDMVDMLGILAPFASVDRMDRESMMPRAGIATIARGADLLLPEGPAGVIVVVRGALSPWLDDDRGPEVTMPAIGPGGFVDYAAALGFAAKPRRFRARSPTRLLRLDAALFAPASPASSRLLYALSRDLATTLRRATGLAMHFGTAWARETRRSSARTAPARRAPSGSLPVSEA